MMLYLQLCWSFFQIGLFGIGGGYAAQPLIRHQVVELHGWLTMGEFVDVITISQMTPGPIAINAATFVGTRICGLPGAIVATIGCVTPSIIIVLTLAYFYYKYRNLNLIQGVLSGLRPGVVALIASAGLSIILLAFWKDGVFSLLPSDIDFWAVGLFAACLLMLRLRKPNPIYVMLGAGTVGGLIYYFLT